MNNNKKYIVLVGDGMSDYPIAKLDGLTPLEAAKTPNMDFIAQNSVVGLTNTIPEGMLPGSDTGNLSIFGYNPKQYYTGRSPLEAINMGITLGEKDVAFRCNLVTLNDGIMDDFTAGHIESDLTTIVIKELKKHIDNPDLELYSGVSYRSTLIWRNFPYAKITDATPPHDIQGKNIARYLPCGDGADVIRKLIEQSWQIIQDSEVIQNAIKKYNGNPTSIWLWGAGRRPTMESFAEKFGLYGYTISAVDLIHGIGLAVGLSPKIVEGVTGYIDTNYIGKAEAALEVLEDANFVYVHVESPDESGHEGNVEHKVKSIEDFDEKVVGKILEGLKQYDDYSILLMPDHATPISIRTHTTDPVPFCLYNNHGFPKPDQMLRSARAYNEVEAKGTGLLVHDAYTLLDSLVKGKI